MQSMMKPKQETDETDFVGVVYIENDTELSCVIRPGIVYDEKQTGQ